MAKANGEALERGARVKAAVDLVGVPEGTTGTVSMSTGIDWIRYWVSFDNGIERGSLARSKLVPVKQWDRYLVEREQAALEAAARAEAGEDEGADGEEAGAAAAGGDEVVVNGVTVPPHLLERAASARSRLTG